MIIDAHGHITSPELFKRFPMPPALADIEGMIEQKLRSGIGLTVVGSPVGEGTMMRVPGLDNYAQPPEQLRRFHDWLAGTVARHPRHLRAYAYTNPFGGERLLNETARTVREGGFVGLIANTSVQGRYLDADDAAPFWEMAAELNVPVFLHPPAEPVGAASLADYRLVEQVARFNDVTSGLAAIVFGGILERHPALQVIGATSGGSLSLIAGRLDVAFRPRHWDRKPGEGPPSGGPPAGGPPPGAGPAIQQYVNRISEPPSTYIRRLWVDTATYSRPSLHANLEMMGADHMLFGTDSPPLATPIEAAVAMVRELPIPEDDRRKILCENALRLFKLDAAEIGG